MAATAEIRFFQNGRLRDPMGSVSTGQDRMCVCVCVCMCAVCVCVYVCICVCVCV